MITFSREAPLDKEKFVKRYSAHIRDGYRPSRNRANRYLQNRDEMGGKTYSGMGLFLAEHDLFAVESMGPVADRAQEHLGYADKPVLALWKLMFHAIHEMQEGRDPAHVVRDPAANRFPDLVVLSEVIAAASDWKEYWKTKVQG